VYFGFECISERNSFEGKLSRPRKCNHAIACHGLLNGWICQCMLDQAKPAPIEGFGTHFKSLHFHSFISFMVTDSIVTERNTHNAKCCTGAVLGDFLANVNSCSCSLYVVVRPSVYRLSVVCRMSYVVCL